MKSYLNRTSVQLENKYMRDKCLNCPDYPYVTNENRKQICYRCDLEDAVNEFKAALKDTWLYKFMIKILDWLEAKLEKL